MGEVKKILLLPPPPTESCQAYGDPGKFLLLPPPPPNLVGFRRSRKIGPPQKKILATPLLADKKITTRVNYKLTISKLVLAHERALGRARSQRFRDNEKLKKINERCRKDRLPALTLKLMRGDAPGSNVSLATYSATTEEAIVMRSTSRSSRWDVSHEYTENVETEVKTEDSPERLTVSFKCHEDKMK